MAKRDYLKQVKESIAEVKAPQGFPVKFIAIDGHGGSGKSTLAKLLAKELQAEIIHQDDFASQDNPLNWWPDVIKKVFEPIRRGTKTLSYPRNKWWPDHNPKPVVDQPGTPIMILEGVGSTRKEFRPYLTYKIWVETPRGVCLTRGMERDQFRGSPEEVRRMWEKWLEEEDDYIAHDNPIGNADLIVEGTREING